MASWLRRFMSSAPTAAPAAAPAASGAVSRSVFVNLCCQQRTQIMRVTHQCECLRELFAFYVSASMSDSVYNACLVRNSC